jgi:long-subunit fatty acid transport protein
MKAFNNSLFYVLPFFLLLLTAPLVAQNTTVSVIDSTGQKPKLKFGVGFGMSFVGGTNVSLAPTLSYPLSQKVSVAAGVQASYTSIKDLQNTFTFGGSVMTLYTPVKILSLLAEFTQLNVTTEKEVEDVTSKDSYWDSALFLGGGINITEKISVGAKYNLLYDEDESVYTSPVIPFVNITF